MASYTTPSQSLYMKSTWNCTGSYGMTTRTTQTSSLTFNFSSIPAGSTIHSATMYATIAESPSTGAAVRSVNDGSGASTFNIAGHAVSIAAGTSKSYEFKFRANGQAHEYTGSHVSAFTYTNLRIVVSYTPPYTAPTMGNVTLAGSTAIRYTAASAASAIAWTASNGSYNTIQSYNRQISVNGGGYTNLAFTSGGNVTANATPGGYHQYRVQAVGEYSSSGWAYSPVLYSYSAVSAPTNLTLSKATVYTNEVLSLGWSASSAGVGVNVSLYRIQENSANKSTTTSTSYSLTAPATAGTYTYRVRAEGSVAGYDSSYTGTVTLTVIPRQSTYTLNKSTVALGDTITATIVPVDPAFTHQVTFVLGASTLGPYTIAAGDTTYPFLVPASTWGAQLSSATSGTATCQMKTLNAGVQVGDIVNINFTVTVPSTFLPTFSAGPTVVQTGNPTGFTTSSWFIQGVTMPKISATAIGSNGSTITKYNFSIANGGSGEVTGAGAKSWTATTISTAGAAVWTVVATDSRGRTVTATGSIDVTAYSSPSVIVNELYRTTAGGLASGDGTYYKVRATATAVTQGTPLATNAITEIKVQHRLKGTTTWSTAVAITNNTLSAIQGGGLVTILDTWEVRISCRDKIKPSTDVYSSLGALPPAVRAWDFRNDRGALGRFAGAAKTFQLPDDWQAISGRYKSVVSTGTPPLEVASTTAVTNLNADLLDGNHASDFAAASHNQSASTITTGTLPVARGGTGVTTSKAIALLSYPVGAIYMSYVSTSPATLFGGTWSALGGRFLIGADGTYTAGATGGEAMHALTISEIPSHRHDSLYVENLGQALASGHGGNPTTGFGGGFGVNNANPAYLYTTAYTGGNQAHNNMPPYLVVYMWRRTA